MRTLMHKLKRAAALVSTIAAASMIVAASPPARAAAPQPAKAAAPVDTAAPYWINGYWEGWNDNPRPDSEVNTLADKVRFPPALEARLQPWAAKALADYKAAVATRKEPRTPDNHCLPFAMPGERASYGFPLEFAVSPKVILLMIEIDHQMRIIRMNQPHPKHLTPSWYGDSVGHWDGNTLVVDTIGFNNLSDYSDGVPQTERLHIVERYHLIDGGQHMEGDYTYEDPGALTAPYTVVRKFKRSTPFQEYVTAENNTLYECPSDTKGSDYAPWR